MPEFFKVIVSTFIFCKDVNNDVVKIQKNPATLIVTFHVTSIKASFFHFLTDVVSNSFQLTAIHGTQNNKVIC